MQSKIVSLPDMWVAGITTRTHYEQERDMHSGKIFPIWQSYLANKTADTIQNGAYPGVTYAVYTEYETDATGPYTFLLGEVVSSSQDNTSLSNIHIPTATYRHFTLKGALPDIVIEAWSKIWQMSPQELGGTRSFISDFEVYDYRKCDVTDPSNATVNLYIGIKN